MKKKIIIIAGAILFVGIVGFQIVEGHLHMLQSPGAEIEDYQEIDYGLGTNYVDKLPEYPELGKGERTPFDLYKYAGKDKSSFMERGLGMEWEEWVALHKEQKPKLMADVKLYMNGRYNFSNEPINGVYMSGNRKQVMNGPISKLPKGISSYEELAKLSADEIKKRNLFPYVPLAHPLHTTAHMVFPDQYLKYHPEHARIDVDHDIPDNYLPEYPAPIFVTTQKE